MEKSVFTNLSISELREVIGSEIRKQISGLKNESKNGSSLLNVNEASELIGYTKSTLYTKVSRNEIPYLKQGGLLRFNREDLSNWIQSGKNLTATEIDKKSTDYLIKNS